MADLNNEEYEQVTLVADDGTEVLYDVISIFPVDDKNYIALFPADSSSEDDDILLCRLVQTGEDDFDLESIDDDDEFERVSDAFDELLDAAEFDEIINEED